MKRRRHFVLGLLCMAGLSMGLVSNVIAHEKEYDVTITNLTRGEFFTPIMVSTHHRNTKMFMLGAAPSDALAAMAEGGATDDLAMSIMSENTASNGELLKPGASTTIRVSASKYSRYISVAAMLIPTNDAFIAVNGVKLPKGRHALKIMSPVYDAGSEPNDELCMNIPGPVCEGAGGTPDVIGEDYVHIHAGIQGIGDLDAADYDWRNPAAKIVIKRVDY